MTSETNDTGDRARTDRWNTDRWKISDLDLPGYLERTGLDAREPSREALDELHTAHVRTFPFENIDVLLGQHPGIELATVSEKFLHRRRGGYCFEHSTLFAAVLERFGYRIERHLGRVGDPANSGRTHVSVVVNLDGERLLCDPGFGMSLLRPIPLRDGAEAEQDGWKFGIRLVRTQQLGELWQLSRLHEDWELMHSVDEVPVRPADLKIGHHFSSTHPDSHFTDNLVLTRHEMGRHLSASPAGLTIRVPGQPTERRPIEASELSELLPRFGIELSTDEHQRLLARWPSLQP